MHDIYRDLCTKACIFLDEITSVFFFIMYLEDTSYCAHGRKDQAISIAHRDLFFRDIFRFISSNSFAFFFVSSSFSSLASTDLGISKVFSPVSWLM